MTLATVSLVAIYLSWAFFAALNDTRSQCVADLELLRGVAQRESGGMRVCVPTSSEDSWEPFPLYLCEPRMSAPIDPWGREYVINPGRRQIASLGRDARLGGIGEDADTVVRY